ncbi:MAG TPA: hypothetical protein VG839_00475 [Asticcacaulis sp.]|nr:hypothetical protein [Asticcacaulis sp.]
MSFMSAAYSPNRADKKTSSLRSVKKQNHHGDKQQERPPLKLPKLPRNRAIGVALQELSFHLLRPVPPWQAAGIRVVAVQPHLHIKIIAAQDDDEIGEK